MAVRLNRKGYNYARDLIQQGKVDLTSSWSFSTEDENKILGDGNWDEYAKWFLAVDDEYDSDTKARYKFPYGKNGKVYRRGVIAAKQRAAQQGYTEIENAADRLLQMIDEKYGEGEEKGIKLGEAFTNKVQHRTFSVETRAISERERTVELSFSSEYPVERWYGKEYLSHDEGAVNVSPLVDVGSVLRNHDPDQIVAKPVKVWVDTKARKGKAIIQFGTTELAEKTFQEVKEGLLRGVSVGYRIREYRWLDENEVWERFEGPGIVATRWDVLEISLVSVPADHTVGVGRSIQKTQGGVMMKATQPQDREEILKLERERIKAIRELCRQFNLDALADELIDSGASMEEARAKVLEELARRSKPVGPSIHATIVEDEKDKVRAAAVDGIRLRAGWKIEKPAEGAEKFRGMTLERLAEYCLRKAGVQTDGLTRTQLIRKAFSHSTSDFPNILMDAVGKALLDAYGEVPTTFKKWTKVVSASDFKKRYVVKLGSFSELDEVPEGAEFKEKTISEEKEEYSIATYGAIFSITRQTIINDDLDAFSRIPMHLGRAARRTVEKTVYNILNTNPVMSDGNTLFSTAHGNVGTAGAISNTTLKEIRKLMGQQKDPDGNLIYLRPGYLIVPPAIATDAMEWMNSTYFPGKSNNQPNIWQRWAEVIETPYTSADAGGSDTAWYVIADPTLVDTVEVAFLDGQEEPTIETDRGFEVDGIKFKVRLDFGAAPVDWRGMFKNAGS